MQPRTVSQPGIDGWTRPIQAEPKRSNDPLDGGDDILWLVKVNLGSLKRPGTFHPYVAVTIYEDIAHEGVAEQRFEWTEPDQSIDHRSCCSPVEQGRFGGQELPDPC